ncbi:IS110 family transposase [Cereibacter sediminicola]|uniref:IS110 family transposase n=1 Tax=Cereibacter sediminicola TaxID=2584941 RepID=UPI0011A2CAEF|nr:IS110 family transposase [Cereibacter sediminicola]
MRISVGMDVAKAIHWACAFDETGRTLLDRAVENTPEAIASFAADLRTLGGEPVIGLDVVGSFAHFLGASLLAEGFRLVHAPGIAVNRAGQGFAGGERKSDPRDARTIADLVRTRDLRPILPDDETVTAIRLKVGRRRDLIEEQTRRLNRLRGLLSSVHPGPERDLDVTCKGPLVLLTRYVTPAEIRQAGKRRIMAHLAKTPHVQRAEALADHALAAARAQTLAVPGETAMAELVREMATEALETRTKITRLDRDLAALLAVHPDGALIQSLPGMGAVLAAEFIACVGDIRRFPSADALASAAGLAPVIRQSGRKAGWRRTYGGDKALKRVFYQGAFCAVCRKDPLSRAFYDRKRREGKHHTQALIALARRRVTVLWTMLQTRQTFDPLKNAA